MCTAVSFNFSNRLFARTLDLDSSYGEEVIFTPRGFRLEFKHGAAMSEHYAILGAGKIFDGTPLYFDAFNEAGLAAAALNFPTRAAYFAKKEGRVNVASYELIGFVLSRCANLSEAKGLLSTVNITEDAFSEDLPTTPLHWIISDKTGAVTLESTESGVKVYENPVGILTNSPEFSYHIAHLSDFLRLDSVPPENEIYPSAELSRYSGGLGAMGLPGDFSSSSRFVRAVFLKGHSLGDNISHAFHVMENISVPKGAVIKENGKPFFTVYTSVADMNERVYYFTTAESRRIRAVKMNDALMDTERLASFSMSEEEKIYYVN